MKLLRRTRPSSFSPVFTVLVVVGVWTALGSAGCSKDEPPAPAETATPQPAPAAAESAPAPAESAPAPMESAEPATSASAAPSAAPATSAATNKVEAASPTPKSTATAAPKATTDAPAPSAAATPKFEGEPCHATKFQFAQVRYACEHGGIAGAKALMKEQVKKAKAAGKDVKCKSCHSNTKTYETKPNAVKDLKPWL